MSKVFCVYCNKNRDAHFVKSLIALLSLPQMLKRSYYRAAKIMTYAIGLFFGVIALNLQRYLVAFSVQTKFESWESQVPSLQFNGTENIDSILVPTAETVSMLHFCKTILKIHAPVMCIGSAGCGKTQLCKAALGSLNPEYYSAFSINFNFYTDSALLQTLLEQPLEKKAGRQFGPPGK